MSTVQWMDSQQVDSIRSRASETASTATNNVNAHGVDSNSVDNVEQMWQQIQSADASLTSFTSMMSDVSHASEHTFTVQSLSSRQSTSPSQVSAPSRPTQTVDRRTSTDLSQNAASCSSNTPSSNYQHSDPASGHLTSSLISMHLPDFTGIEIPWREYPAKLREPQYDAVIISAVDDRYIAAVFKYILSQYITLEVCFIQSSQRLWNVFETGSQTSFALCPLLLAPKPIILYVL